MSYNLELCTVTYIFFPFDVVYILFFNCSIGHKFLKSAKDRGSRDRGAKDRGAKDRGAKYGGAKDRGAKDRGQKT